MNWEKIWQFLNTPPPKFEIPAIEKFMANCDSVISKWIAQQILNLTQVLDKYLLSTPVDLLHSKAFHMIYLLTTGIAFAALLPAVGVIGFKALNGKISGEEVLKQLGQLALVPLGIVIAPPIIIAFLTLMNTLARILVYATPLINDSDKILFPTGLELGLVIFTVIYIVLVIRLILYYCYRNYGLLFLVASLPLILLISAVGQAHRIQRWMKEMLALGVTQVIHALQLLILVAMTIVVGGNSEPGIPMICIQIGALLYMNKTPHWVEDYIHDAPDPVAVIEKARDLKNQLNPMKFFERVKDYVKRKP